MYQPTTRVLTVLEQEVPSRCDGRVTVADLADDTLQVHPQIRAALHFLTRHGLVKTLPAEPWLFTPPTPLPTRQRTPAELPSVPTGSRAWRWFGNIKRTLLWPLVDSGWKRAGG